jgi:hypothetical protein
MDAWKNARAIEELKEEIANLKKHMLNITQIILKDHKPEKKGWFGRDKDGEKDEGIQRKQDKA